MLQKRVNISKRKVYNSYIHCDELESPTPHSHRPSQMRIPWAREDSGHLEETSAEGTEMGRTFQVSTVGNSLEKMKNYFVLLLYSVCIN